MGGRGRIPGKRAFFHMEMAGSVIPSTAVTHMKHTTRMITADELLRLSGDGVRRELIRGELRDMTPPGEEHGWVTGKLVAILGHFILEKKLGRFLTSETGFLIERNPDTVRAPDFAFTRTERLTGPAKKKYATIPPDLVIETVSPDDRPRELKEKVAAWLRFGVRLVWIIDPGEREVAVHDAGKEGRTPGEGQFLEGEDVIPGFRLAVDEIWR
jgi:Uma2 family endonuclease